MLVTISPAKKLDWDQTASQPLTEPRFGKEALSLAKTARNLSLGDLRKLMHLSDDLARLNRDRFRAYDPDPSDEHLRAAALAFAGDTYQGLQAWGFDGDDMDWAQDHLCILSGLYGVLRPLDGIQPYRLEMGSRLKTRRGSNLYHYWGKEISKVLNAQADAQGANYLLNCASQEYFGAVDQKALTLPIIQPVFLEEKDGAAKTVSFFAKRARGMLARHVIVNRITDPKDLQSFAADGYRCVDVTDQSLTFSRPYPEPA